MRNICSKIFYRIPRQIQSFQVLSFIGASCLQINMLLQYYFAVIVLSSCITQVTVSEENNALSIEIKFRQFLILDKRQNTLLRKKINNITVSSFFFIFFFFIVTFKVLRPYSKSITVRKVYTPKFSIISGDIHLHFFCCVHIIICFKSIV